MAGTAGGSKNGMGWAILAAALAVPGFLFYNWWSHLKAEHDRGVSAKARGRLPEGGVFQTPSPAGGRLVNPMASTATAVAVATAAAVPGSPALAAKPTTPPATSAPAAAPATPVASAATPAVPPAAAAPGVSPTPAVPGAPATAAGVAPSTSTVVLPRDPMMSPMDIVRLREEELARIRHEEEMRRALAERNRPKPKIVHREPPPETKIDLQGIVETPDGAGLAIVNGSTVKSGESFVAEGLQGKVRVVRITSSEVTFEYKGKRFKKGVSAE